MRLVRRHIRRHLSRLGKQTTLVVLALLYAVLVSGVGLPTAAIKPKPGSPAERFPCEACPCGCKTPDQCWRNCCCHTPAQRLAWARKNGVTPPAFVIAQTEAKSRRSCCSKGCCSKKAKPVVAAQTPSRPTSNASTPTPPPPDEPQPEPPIDSRVVGWQALKCHGQTLAWLMAAPTLTAPPEALVLTSEPPAWRPPCSSLLAPGVSHRPPVPPPRVG